MEELLQALDDLLTNDADLLLLAMEHSHESARMFGGEQAEAVAKHSAEAKYRLNVLIESWQKAGRSGDDV